MSLWLEREDRAIGSDSTYNQHRFDADSIRYWQARAIDDFHPVKSGRLTTEPMPTEIDGRLRSASETHRDSEDSEEKKKNGGKNCI
jgi:hypothetical protein